MLLNGGFVNGVQTDPVTYVIHALAEQFAQLGEENRIGTMADLLNFHRGNGESIDELLSRFDLIRMRAHEHGQLALSIQGLSFVLRRSVGVNDNYPAASTSPAFQWTVFRQ